MNRFHLVTLALLAGSASAYAGQVADGPNTEVGIAGSVRLGDRNIPPCEASVDCKHGRRPSGKIFADTLVSPSWGWGAAVFRTQPNSATLTAPTTALGATAQTKGAAVTAYMPWKIDAFTFKARLGVGYADTTVHYTDGTARSVSGLVPVVGAGVSYALSKEWSVRADWDYLPSKPNAAFRTQANTASVGLFYHF